MKFSEIEYTRPDIEKLENDFRDLLVKFKNAENFEAQDEFMKQINELRLEYETQNTLAHIKYSTDTFNKDYEQEQHYFDLNNPVYEGLIHTYYEEIVASKFRKELEDKWGKQLFDYAELTLKTYKPIILDDLKAENELRTEYVKLISSARIFFDGEERNLAGLVPFLESPIRDTREKANNAKWKFFSDNAAEFDRIFDELVKLRHKIALKLGYSNYVQLGYDKMNRTDYNPAMVAKFRNNVIKHIVPITIRLKNKQQQRLGVDSMKYYDQPVDYKTGNAKPHGTPEWIVSCATNMYSELSAETNEFFSFMVENDLMDLITRHGKDTGGYCTFIEKYRAPFIFSNFNGTMGDVEVLTHEAGHAFQAYSSRNFEIPEYFFPTSEACEIHSMSMEYLTWPWMNCFFKDQVDKFKYSHMKGSMIFIPYGCAVDEFQHFVYENPYVSPAERNQAWIEIESKYIPNTDYDGNKFLEKGGRWQQQRHIYLMPFYYIDYCLAQICAFQFWKKAQDNRENAVTDYLRLCKAGGSMSFLELVKLANLISPFDESCMETFTAAIEKWLEDQEHIIMN
jgi:M3 family oligoendopeptidase